VFRSLRNTARVRERGEHRGRVDPERRRSVRGRAGPSGGDRGRKVFEVGDLDIGIWSAGMVQGLIRDIRPCRAGSSDRTEARQLIAGRLAGVLA